MFAQYFGGQTTGGRSGRAGAGAAACPECRSSVPADSKFCPQCGHQLVVFSQCSRCGKNLAPNAKFCSALRPCDGNRAARRNSARTAAPKTCRTRFSLQ
ncbi:MAG: zinc ribbon domain-containing protein [Desulfobacterales bacterium]|nr:zinc ribbon domain-containing protein [Desulfobacterales bacterium]